MIEEPCAQAAQSEFGKSVEGHDGPGDDAAGDCASSTRRRIRFPQDRRRGRRAGGAARRRLAALPAEGGGGGGAGALHAGAGLGQLGAVPRPRTAIATSGSTASTAITSPRRRAELARLLRDRAGRVRPGAVQFRNVKPALDRRRASRPPAGHACWPAPP